MKVKQQWRIHNPLLVLTGPTASGKTAVAIEVCHQIGGEVVSCDSMQIYKGLSIGTAKPTQEEMEGIPHHLLSIVEPDAPFSVAEYREKARAVIADIHARGKVAVLCGGTGLYMDALTRPMDLGNTPRDESLRQALLIKSQQDGGKHLLHQELAQVDALSAQRLHENDVRRVIRALEVYALTGLPISAQRNEVQELPFTPFFAAIHLPRELMYARIDARVDQMLKLGLLEEAKSVWKMNLPMSAPALKALGYKEFFAYFEGKNSLEDCIAFLKQRTRNYAKRQMTWLRRDKRIHWLDGTKVSLIIAQELLQVIENVTSEHLRGEN